MTVLALRNVSRSFGPIEVLHGVDIALRPGRVHALIGENGAGKSTTMKIMAGYQPPSSGQVLLDGQPVTFANMGAAEDRASVIIKERYIQQRLLPGPNTCEAGSFPSSTSAGGSPSRTKPAAAPG